MAPAVNERRTTMEIQATTYWEEIERLARAALEEERLHGRNAYDALRGFIESHSWAIYPYYTLQVPRFNGTHDDDFLEAVDFSAVLRDRGLNGVFSKIAFACLLGDAKEKLKELRRGEEK